MSVCVCVLCLCVLCMLRNKPPSLWTSGKTRWGEEKRLSCFHCSCLSPPTPMQAAFMMVLKELPGCRDASLLLLLQGAELGSKCYRNLNTSNFLERSSCWHFLVCEIFKNPKNPLFLNSPPPQSSQLILLLDLHFVSHRHRRMRAYKLGHIDSCRLSRHEPLLLQSMHTCGPARDIASKIYIEQRARAVHQLVQSLL